MAGLVSWTAIEDRNRTLMGLTTYKSPKEAVQDRRQNYHIDKWEDQPWRPEVWVEKAALEGVIGGICDKLQVDFFATRGYNSIGALSRSLGTEGFGTEQSVPVDLAANAESLGARVFRAGTLDELRDALERAKAETTTVVIAVKTDRLAEGVPGYESWWDVPVAEVAQTESVRAAREEYEQARVAERRFL